MVSDAQLDGTKAVRPASGSPNGQLGGFAPDTLLLVTVLGLALFTWVLCHEVDQRLLR